MLSALIRLLALLLTFGCTPRPDGPTPTVPPSDPAASAPNSPAAATPPTAPRTLPVPPAPTLDPSFAGTPPDILVVVLDTTSPRAIAEAMPHAQAFLDSARRYPEAIAPSNSTMESVAGVFTGAHMSNARLWEPGITTLAQSLKLRGYSTYIASANVVLTHDFFGRGFDVNHRRREDKTPDFPDRGEVEHFEATWPTMQGPRFAWVQLLSCHDYRVAGKDYETDGQARGDEQLAEAWTAYLPDCAQTDSLLPRLLAANPDGVTVVTADHGELFGHLGSYPFAGQGEHGHGISSSPMEVQVPLGIRGPGFVAGDDPRPVSLLDLHPTLLAAAGMKAPGGDLRGTAPLRPRVSANCYLDDDPSAEYTAWLEPDGTQIIRTSGRKGVPELVRWTPGGVGAKPDWTTVDPKTLSPDVREALYEDARLLCVTDDDLCRQHPGLESLGYIDCPD
jgi:arylsulfatase A-like enzyme